MSKQNEQINLGKKAQSYMKENERLLRKYNLAIRPVINFPKSAKIPLLSRIALWLVRKQGGINDIQFGEIKKD